MGAGSDTTAGGLQSEFPRTTWSWISRGDELDAEGTRLRLSELFQTYWRPIYTYVRIKWSKENEEAKDIVQEFFLRMLEGDFLDRFEPERGRFRTFVKVAMDHFIMSRHRSDGMLRRGGRRPELSIEWDCAAGDIVAAETVEDPEAVFDQQWSRALLDHAIARVEEDFIETNREEYLEVFRAHEFHAEAEGPPSYTDLAKRFRVSEVDISNYIQRVKRAIRQAITDLIRESVEDEEALREELKHLLGEP